MYHSHVGLQLDRALVGPLIVEERTTHVSYDREHTLLLDDLTPGDPVPVSERAYEARDDMMNRMPDPDRQGEITLNDPARPDYAALLVNGRHPDDPPAFEVRRGERVRLRLVNPASATIFRVAIAGHRMAVSHTDGRPVEPVTVDSLLIGPGEREIAQERRIPTGPSRDGVRLASDPAVPTRARDTVRSHPRATASSDRADGSAPNASTDPRLGRSTVAAIFSRVVFPAPFAPTTPRTVPGRTSRSTRRSAHR